jgi:integrase
MQENSARVAEFLHWFRVTKGRAPQSCKAYEWTLDKWVSHLGSTAVGVADTSNVDDFLTRPLPRYGLPGAPATRRHNLAILASFYKWLCATEPSCRNPTVLVGTPAVKNRKPRAIDDDVWRTVWRNSLPVERAWLGLGFFTGLRAGELARLRVEHFDQASGEIVGFIRKGGGEGHISCDQMAHLFHKRLAPLLPVPEAWLTPLGELAASRSPGESLIPWTDSPPNYTVKTSEHFGLLDGEYAPVVPARRLKGVLRRADLHPNIFTPHALRHSFVGNALRMGIPLHIVQRLADHSSPATTMRYGQSTGRMLAEWMGNTPPD